MDTLGTRLRKLRNQNGYTLEYVANKLGTTKVSIMRYEKDDREPKSEMLNALAGLYAVSLDYLLGRTPNTTELTQKDKKDIAKDLEAIMTDLQEGNALAYGDVIDPRDIPALQAGLNIILEQIKTQNKQKYTPNKYKK